MSTRSSSSCSVAGRGTASGASVGLSIAVGAGMLAEDVSTARVFLEIIGSKIAGAFRGRKGVVLLRSLSAACSRVRLAGPYRPEILVVGVEILPKSRGPAQPYLGGIDWLAVDPCKGTPHFASSLLM